MASSNDAVIQELLFRLASVYIDRLTNTKSEKHTAPKCKSLKSADDLVRLLGGLCLVTPPPNSFNLFNNQIIKTRVSCNQLLPCLCLFQVNSCSHYGAFYPWLILLSPTDITSSQHLEALHKLQVFSKVCFDCMDSIQLSP